MSDQAGDKALEFPINQALLEDATKAKEEWRVIKDRLAKIDENKKEVSESVFARVRRDYESRLSKATEVLIQRRQAVDRELKSLKDTSAKINVELANHKQKLEEIKFRNTLGEFNEEEYQAKARLEQEKVSKFETVIAAVEANIARYVSIFEDEDVQKILELPREEVLEKKVPPEPKLETDTNIEDEFEDVNESAGPDYFGAPGEAPASPVPEVSETLRNQILEPKQTKTPHSANSRVIMINGDSAGEAYPLKGVVSLGRAESNTIVLKDAKVSRQHAQIQEQGGEYVILDLNSSNGTFVNSQRVEEYVLTDGDEIKIGDYILQFEA